MPCLLGLRHLQAQQLEPRIDDRVRQRRRLLGADEVGDQLRQQWREEADDARPTDQADTEPQRRQHGRQKVLHVRLGAFALLQVVELGDELLACIV